MRLSPGYGAVDVKVLGTVGHHKTAPPQFLQVTSD
jgi:hypothetical protein